MITGGARRRRFPTEQKVAVVAETMQPGMSISYVARRHGLSPSLVLQCIIVAYASHHIARIAPHRTVHFAGVSAFVGLPGMATSRSSAICIKLVSS